MGKRKFSVVLFPNPEKKIMTFSVSADTLDVDPRGNAIFKDDGRITGIVSNPAYQVIRELVEIEIIKKDK
jgi:hypothetical protein